MKRALFVSLLLWLAAIAPSAPAQEAEQSERERNRDTYLMDADGSNVRRLTSSRELEGHPAW